MKKKNREKLRLITLRVCIGILCAFVSCIHTFVLLQKQGK